MPHILVVIDGWQEVIRGSVSGKDGHMAKRDDKHLITTKELKDQLEFEKMSTLRIYVSKYKIFVPIAKDNKDRRKLKYDGRCCAIRKELLDYVPPSSGIMLEEAGEYLNEICGKNDEELLNELNAKKPVDKIIEEKINELLDRINNGPKPEGLKKKDDKK